MPLNLSPKANFCNDSSETASARRTKAARTDISLFVTNGWREKEELGFPPSSCGAASENFHIRVRAN